MITHLKGKIEFILDNTVVLDVNGIGYSVTCSSKTIEIITNNKEIIHLFTQMIIREDSWSLYGFISNKERIWFNLLNSVQGVSGKVSIAILSALNEEEIYNAFLVNDKDAFLKADGVGAKLSNRIMTELKEKTLGNAKLFISNSIVENTHDCDHGYGKLLSDVISALMNLGYPKHDIMKVLASIKQSEKDFSFNEMFKDILKKLSSGDY